MTCVDEDEYETGIGVKPETLVGSFGDMRGRRKEIISVGSRKVIGSPIMLLQVLKVLNASHLYSNLYMNET